MAERHADTLWLVIPAAQRASGEWIDDTLARRLREQGLIAKAPMAGDFPRNRVEVVRDSDPWRRANDLFLQRGWTDGLPIVPPTVARVAEMVECAGFSRDHVVAELDPLKGVATVEKIAVQAVMAGCAPEYISILIALTEAIATPEFNLRGVQTTDENVTPLLIFSGPIAERLNINSGFGALGPGWRANATIGRALRLIMQNLGGGWPGAVSLAGLGQPGRYSLCLAENAAQNPWQPLHSDLGFAIDASAVTVMRAETAINVTGGLEEIASVMGSAASQFSLMHGGKVAVVLAPYVARQLAGDGWTKADVKLWLHERGRVPAAQWERSWSYKTLTAHRWPRWVTRAAAQGAIPVVESPDDLTLIVAGGDLHIAQHAYLPTWGFPPCRITRQIA
ncbi:MAG TPA: hypothetical protein VJN94_04955 [Candidatus Binataceae bacterium]|nr:hypothetical protein [Candidatus Binataceae bacterium]